jgi:hypothetical protein
MVLYSHGKRKRLLTVVSYFFAFESLTVCFKRSTRRTPLNLHDTATRITSSYEQRHEANTDLQRRWIFPVRCLWIALVILTLAIFIASLPIFAALLQTICTGIYGTVCAYQQLSPEQVAMLKGLGLSLGAYATFTIALTIATMVASLVVSALIVWRRSDDRMALIVALMLVTLAPINAVSTVTVSSTPWQIPNECLEFLGIGLIMLVFLLFPGGQFVPRWTRWTLVVSLAGQVPNIFFPNASFTQNSHADALGYFLLVSEAAILVIVLLYRYRRVSSPMQRQQTKWVVFGMAIPTIIYFGGSALYLIFPPLAQPNLLYGAPYQLALSAIFSCLLLCFPLAFGFAMLRSRLWDIDVLINRTLIYGTLTVTLALVYFGLVIGLQSLVRLVAGTISELPLVIVASTLAIVALFEPLRRRIQTIIDRRFYRRKYDAARTLAAFSATLRQEVDLDQLREDLVTVVEETMQPTFVSLWLRQPGHAQKIGTHPER